MLCFLPIILTLLDLSSAQHSIKLKNVSAEPRIIAGTETTIQQYPFLVGMLQDVNGVNQFVQTCAGTILTARHILSAANCYKNGDFWGGSGHDYTQPQYWKVRAGSSFRSSGGNVVDVAEIINYPDYDDWEDYNDISIVVLATKLTFGDTIAQASIPPQGYQIPDNVATIAVGWGVTETDNNIIPLEDTRSEVLLEAYLQTVNQTDCRQMYLDGFQWYLFHSMMCAGPRNDERTGICTGDSGGPLLVDDVVVGVIIGTTNFVRRCARPSYPDVYTTVSAFTDWVIEVVGRT